MDNRQEMEIELQSRLQVSSNSTQYPASRLTTLIQDAYKWATTMFTWLDLVDAKETNSKAGYEYYDYPEDFRSSSIVMLTMDGDEYTRKNFEDYQDFKRNNPNSTEKIFANYGRRFFIFPTPTTNGTNNISIWGQGVASSLSSPSSTTIFTNNKVEGNEAIVKKALSVALVRIDPPASVKEESEALAILTKINKDEWKSTQRDQRIQHPKFAVPNYFGTTRYRDPIGGFSYQP